MSIHIIKLAATANTPASAPLSARVNLSQNYLRTVYVNTEAAGLGFIGIRILNNASQLAPTPGLGLETWLQPWGNWVTWNEFKQLFGPPYEIVVQFYNTDTSGRTVMVYLETSREPGLPVDVLHLPDDMARILTSPTEIE